MDGPTWTEAWIDDLTGHVIRRNPTTGETCDVGLPLTARQLEGFCQAQRRRGLGFRQREATGA